MRIYPAIDVHAGRTVQLVGGDPDRIAVDEGAPAAQAKRWREAGARRLHVVDLDAALGGTPQWSHLHGVLEQGLPVQFGGGVRRMTEIQHLLDLGIDRVIVGTQGVQEPRWARELGHVFPGRVILAIDARGRDVTIKGWTEDTGLDVVELARALDDACLAGFLYTNVAREGRLEGLDLDVVRDLRDACRQSELIVSGGITTPEDLDALAAIGVDGVVLGMSIYKGRIDLKDAVAAHETAADVAAVASRPAPASLLRERTIWPTRDEHREDEV